MIPLATTHITVARRQVQYEKYEQSDADYVDVQTGIGAHIYNASGSNNHTEPGTTQTKTVRLVCDPIDLQVDDRVTDEITGAVYNVESTHTIGSFLPQTLAQLQSVSRV